MRLSLHFHCPPNPRRRNSPTPDGLLGYKHLHPSDKLLKYGMPQRFGQFMTVRLETAGGHLEFLDRGERIYFDWSKNLLLLTIPILIPHEDAGRFGDPLKSRFVVVDHGQRGFLSLGSQNTIVHPNAEQYVIVGLLAPINIDAGVAH